MRSERKEVPGAGPNSGPSVVPSSRCFPLPTGGRIKVRGIQEVLRPTATPTLALSLEGGGKDSEGPEGRHS